MKKIKIGICTMGACASLFLGACSVHAEGAGGNPSLTARETAECVMESLKEVDIEQFNGYTDNYVETYYNWMGVPTRKQYRVFNELLQPGIKVGKWKDRYEFSSKLTEKMMENLAWEIEAVEEDRNSAEITMRVTNLNMADVMGKYELSIWEDMIESTGTGLGQMIQDLSNITDDEGGLLAIIESCDQDDICTLEVTVTAYRDDGAWVLHLDDEFINAFMGNINAEEYSEELQQKIKELEIKQDEKQDEWEEKFSEDVERWVDELF